MKRLLASNSWYAFLVVPHLHHLVTIFSATATSAPKRSRFLKSSPIDSTAVSTTHILPYESYLCYITRQPSAAIPRSRCFFQSDFQSNRLTSTVCHADHALQHRISATIHSNSKKEPVDECTSQSARQGAVHNTSEQFRSCRALYWGLGG